MVYVPLSERPEWSDVVPVPQNDGPNPIVLIEYSSEFVEVMSYFRAIVAAKEHSPRALELTKEVIARNGASVFGWNYRWCCLLAMGSDLIEELGYLNGLSEKFPKNYQIWQHRRLVVGKLGASYSQPEIEVTAKVLENDCKNYHAWSHRQWVVRTFGLWDAALDFCTELIRQDVRNNSAWNERHFVLTRGGDNKANLEQVRDLEIEFTADKIRLAPDNESAWNYFRGLACGNLLSSLPAFKQVPTEILESVPECSLALSLLADVLEEEAQSDSLTEDQKSFARAHVQELWEQLIRIDPMRTRYWCWRIQMLKQ